MVDRVHQPFIAASAVWDPPNIANGAATSTTVALTGALPGDFVAVSFSLSLAGLTMTAFVSGADTVTVVLANNTSGALDLGSGTVRVRLWPQ